MDLEFWQKNWNQLGQDDPLWAILTDPQKRGSKWEPQEFFATGRKDIGATMAQLKELGLTPNPAGKALDFGCGVGRLSQALAEYFNEVHGIDISPSMIEGAKRFGAAQPKCHFRVNSSNRLEAFPDKTFDFVYTNIVLQHIPSQYQRVYVQEFMRVLKPGGIAVFQMISATLARRLFPQFAVEIYRKLKHGDKAFIGMFGVPQSDVQDIVSDNGARMVHTLHENLTWRWISTTYFVIKEA